jgi:predicted secreted protein
MRRLALALMLVTVPTLAVRAQETILHLAETATIMVPPNELFATLRAEAHHTKSAEAQARVNTLVRDATALAKDAKGIAVSTGAYSVWRIAPTQNDWSERWQASQAIRLVGSEPTTLLTLIGQLQSQGLTLAELQWRLTRDTARASRREATNRALAGLRARAEEAAEILGLRFTHFRAVRLDGAEPVAMPRPALLTTSRTSDATAPIAEPADHPVTAQAQAEAVLLPR